MQGSGRNISACKIIQESDKVAMYITDEDEGE